MKPIHCQGVISVIYDLRFTICAPTANRIVYANHLSQIENGYTFAEAAFCIVTADAPMFGRWPLCHHSTNALAM